MISVRDLAVHHGASVLVSGVDLDVRAGSVVTLFGPSGAGKSTIASAVAGTSRPGLRVLGHVRREGGPPGHLPQHAAETLNPSRRVGTALAELLRIHGSPPRGRRRRRAWTRARLRELLELAGFPTDDVHAPMFLRRHPFEFSGGQRTRLALAQVLATGPETLVLDEPTTGLDEVSRDAVVAMVERIRSRGRAVLLVTHDPVVAHRLSDRVAFVDGGRVVDGVLPTVGERVPFEPLAAGRGGTAALELRGVGVRLGGADLLKDVDLRIDAGEVLGVVGRSGAGKSTMARAIQGLVPLHAGQVLLDGGRLPRLGRRDRAHKAAVQLVWQEAAASFEPWRSVLEQVARTRTVLFADSVRDATSAALRALDALGLDEAAVSRRPRELSGGELRRAAIARAVLARPRVLVCDEVTTGLDRGLATGILDFLDDYRRERGAALLLISHDLDLVGPRCDRVVALERGRVVPAPAAVPHPL